MKTITLGQWLDGEDCPAFIDGRQIECVTFQDGTRYDGIPRVFFTDGGEYVQLADRFALVDIEDDSERAASCQQLYCDYCDAPIPSPVIPCPSCGATGLQGGGPDDPQPPTADKAGQAWGLVVDGQTINEAVVRRLIRQKMDALEKARVTQFALNHAQQYIIQLEAELGGRTVAAFGMTPKGYDALRDDPQIGA